MHFSNKYIDKIPIPEISKASQEPFEKLVDIIIAKKEKNEDTLKEEREIDLMVYKLYDLTYEEVTIIDPEFWLTEEEYSKINFNFK
jgi:hypothetical protein